jgi:ABC-2 type transport system permease protein
MMHRVISAACATFRNELRLLLRDPFCVAVLACFWCGMAWASWNSHSHWRRFANRQSEFQAAARETWLSQSTENAHMATHFGQTVYKPVSPLTGFDPGAVAEFGSSVLLQSHHQSEPANKPRRDEIDLIQDEAYSPAVLLALIGPLLIIMLGSSSMAREKEGGTLSILLTTGPAWPAILAGKGAAVFLVLTVVATPGLLLFAVPWFESNPFLPSMDLLAREVVLLVTMAAYLVGWIGVTMLVSSRSSSNMGGLSVLIALWSIIALVLPRMAGDIAAIVSPLPCIAEIRFEKETAVHEANQSSAESAKAYQALEARLLREFNVDRVEDLPIDMAGARMIEQEAGTNRLFDKVEERISRATNRQNELMEGFQYASPYLAMRAVSTSLTATNRRHHFDFLEAAEKYRRQFVKELNVAEMKKQKPGTTTVQRREFWARIPDFLAGFVPVLEDVKRSSPAMICIFIWAGAAGVASLCAPPQISRTG